MSLTLLLKFPIVMTLFTIFRINVFVPSNNTPHSKPIRNSWIFLVGGTSSHTHYPCLHYRSNPDYNTPHSKPIRNSWIFLVGGTSSHTHYPCLHYRSNPDYNTPHSKPIRNSWIFLVGGASSHTHYPCLHYRSNPDSIHGLNPDCNPPLGSGLGLIGIYTWGKSIESGLNPD